MIECIGRYCPCRGDQPMWVLDSYLPSPWAMEVLHSIWLDGRDLQQATDEEECVLLAELSRLVDNATEALRQEA